MQGGVKNNPGEVQARENTGGEKPLKKKDIVIFTLLCLYWVLSFFVSNSLEECPSEMAEAVSYTFLLLFGYLWVRKWIRMEPRGSIHIILYVIWILLFLQFWIRALSECTGG